MARMKISQRAATAVALTVTAALAAVTPASAALDPGPGRFRTCSNGNFETVVRFLDRQDVGGKDVLMRTPAYSCKVIGVGLSGKVERVFLYGRYASKDFFLPYSEGIFIPNRGGNASTSGLRWGTGATSPQSLPPGIAGG